VEGSGGVVVRFRIACLLPCTLNLGLDLVLLGGGLGEFGGYVGVMGFWFKLLVRLELILELRVLMLPSHLLLVTMLFRIVHLKRTRVHFPFMNSGINTALH
jgi:hypothetical protein